MKKMFVVLNVAISLFVVACGGGGETASSTTITPITNMVSLASDNPASSVVVAGQAIADLAHFTFTNNDTITNVKLQRTGISLNTTLANVYLYQGNTRVSDGVAVNNTDGSITFNNLSIAVNGSVTLKVMADIAALTSGQIVGVQLVSYTTSGNTMSSASISGNNMSVAAATMATAQVGANTIVPANVNVGTAAYRLWSAPITANIHPVQLKGAIFKYIGTAPTNALANLSLYVNGCQVGQTTAVNLLNNVEFNFPLSPILIGVGTTAVIEVRADIVGGSTHNVRLSMQGPSDLVVEDSLLGVDVTLASFTTNDGGVIDIH